MKLLLKLLIKLSLIIAFGITGFAQIPTQCLLFDGTFNGSISDQSASNTSTTASFSPVFAADRYGNVNGAISFDGINDYITLNNNNPLITTSSYSISAWCYTNNNTGGGVNNQNWIFQQRSDATTGSHDILAITPRRTNGNYGFFINNNAMSSQTVLQGSSLPSQQWHHYCLVVSGSSAIAYIDGVQTSSTNIPSGLISNVSYVDLGRHRYAGINGAFLDGRLDDVKIFDCSLSPAQVEELFCPVNSAIVQNYPSQIQLGNSITFNSADTSFSHTWFINGVQVSSDTSFTHQFSQLGSNQVIHTVSDGFCSESDTATITVVINACSPALSDSIQLYYPFSGSALDFSGNGNNGTIFGNPTLATDRFGNANGAYEFDGNGDYINSNTTFDFQERTVALWVKPDATAGTAKFFVSQDHLANLTYGQISARFENGNLRMRAGGESGLFNQSGILTNQWFHLGLVRTSTNVFYYINGTLVGSSFSGSVASSQFANDDFLLGCRRALDQFFDGTLDDVRVYNRALSNDEMEVLYCPAITNINIPDTTVITGSTLNLSNSCSEYPLTWSLNGNAFSTNSSTSLQFNTPGTQEIILESTDGFCTNRDTVYVFVSNQACSVNSSFTMFDSLKLHYPLDGNALDFSGNTNHGVTTGMLTGTTDRYGNNNSALFFNNSLNHINTGSTYDYNNRTIALWVNAASLPGIGASVAFSLAGSPTNGISNGAAGANYSSQGPFNLSAGGTPFHITTLQPGANTWYHLALVRDGANNLRSYYINGQLVGTENSLSGSNGTTSLFDNLMIGVSRLNTNSFHGAIDDFRIYSRVLNPDEVKLLYCPAVTNVNVLDTIVPSGTTLNFSNSCQNYPHTWFINGVQTSTDTSFSFTFNAPGPQQLVLSSTDGFCTNTDTVEIFVTNEKCSNSSVSNIYNGLQLFYPFDGNSTDFSGNNRNGTDVGFPTTSADRYGNSNSAYEFDGVNDYVNTFTTFDYLDRTVTFWVNADNISNSHPNDYHIVTHDAASLTHGTFLSVFTNNTLSSSAGGGSTATYVNNTVSTNQWYHVALVKSGNTLSYYIDGQLEATRVTNSGGSSISPYDKLVIGTSRQRNDGFFDGTLDDLRVYDRDLSPDEIAYLYCPAITSLNVSDTVVSDGTSLTLNNACDEYPHAWFINGSQVSTDTALTSTFSGIGKYTVVLESTDGFCINRDTAFVRILPDPTCLGLDSAALISELQGNFNATLDNLDNLGQSIASLPDRNNDGLPEVVVGVPNDDDGGTDRGAVYLVSTNSNSIVTEYLKISSDSGNFGTGLSNGDNFGFAVSPIGDLNNDGFTDLVVGAPNDDDGGTDRGAVWILFMDSIGVSSKQKISDTQGSLVYGLSNNDRFGSSVSNIGDINNDGVNDIAVGMPNDFVSATNDGSVLILFMNSNGTVSSEFLLNRLDPALSSLLSGGDSFGTSIANLGDINGDGKDELVIGSSGHDGAFSDEGAIYLLSLDITGSISNAKRITASQNGFTQPLFANSNFGTALSSLGDIDNDGYSDLVVSQTGSANGSGEKGAAYLLALDTSGYVFSSIPIHDATNLTGLNSSTSDRFGNGLWVVDDITNDGFPDVLAGAPRRNDGGTEKGGFYVVSLKDTCCPLIVEFDGDFNFCINSTQTFTDISQNVSGGDTYSWFINDSLVSNSQNLTYTFSDSGTALVKLVVDGICSRSFTKQVKVNLPGVTDAGSSQFICLGDSVQLNASGGFQYQWDNGAFLSNDTIANPIAFPTATTIFTVTATDTNGCSDPDNIAIIVNPRPSFTISGDSLICSTQTTSLTGSDNSLSYSWSTITSTNVLSTNNPASLGINTTTTFVASGTSPQGCTDTVHYTVALDTSLQASISSFTNALCYLSNDGTITAAATGGTPNYSFSWTGGGTGNLVQNLAPITYTVTVTDAEGCVDTASQAITQPDSISNTFTADSVICFGESNGTLTAAPTGGTPGYTYNWSTGGTNVDITNQSAGSYTVTITDNNACTNTFTGLIEQPTLLTSVTTNLQNVSCFGGNDGSASVIANGSIPPYLFTWSNGVTSDTNTTLAAGMAYVTITDANNCSLVDSVLITEPNLLTAAITIDTNVSCFGFTDGVATANPTGGTSPYNYIWSNGETTQQAVSLAAGTNSVTITDALGCVVSTSAVLTEPAVLQPSIAFFNNALCYQSNDGIIVASATGGTTAYNFIWSNGVVNDTALNLAPGTYSVTIVDAQGCVDSISQSITEPDSISNTFTADSVNCFGESNGTLTAAPTGGTPGYSYNWSTGGTSVDITNQPAGSYTVTITDNNACTNTFTGIIEQPTLLTSATTNLQNVSCFGGNDGSASVIANGSIPPYSFTWSNGIASDTNTTLAAGMAYVTVTDANNCSLADSVLITEPAILDANITVNSNVSCFSFTDGVATANPTGGTSPYNYIWSNGETTQQAISLAAGTNSVTITDALGCVVSTSAVLTEPAVLQPSIAFFNNALCYQSNNGIIVASATGGTTAYNFTWSNGVVNDTALNLAPGTYTVTVVDAQGCVDSISQSITEPDSISNTFTADSVNCFGESNGTLTAAPTGGTPGYTYNWSTGGTSVEITNQSAGSYTVTITDNNACTNTFTGLIEQPTLLTSSTTNLQNVSCFGGNDGSASVIANGSILPYSFIWSNGITSDTNTTISAGMAYVTVTDANNCSLIDSILITQPAPLAATITVNSNVSCFGFTDGVATANPTGGTTPYSYSWGNGETTQQASSLGAGLNTVTVTDALGCTFSVSENVTQPTLLEAVLDSTKDVLCNGFFDGLAFTSATGGTAPYNFNWNVGDTTPNIDSLTSGTYILSVTDAQGCLDTTAVTIIELTPVVPNSSGVDITCYSFSDGSAQASPTGGGGSNYVYLWSNGATGTSIQNVIADTYWVSVTDQFNCNTVDTIVLSQPDSIEFVFDIDDITCTGFQNGALSATVTGGTLPYSYTWSTSATDTFITNLDSGHYVLEITDINNCYNLDSAYIFEPSQITTQTLLLDSVDCFGNATGDAAVIASGGVGNYQYNWNTGDTTDTILNKVSQMYLVTVNDSNGCNLVDSIFINEPPLLTVQFDSVKNAQCKDELSGYLSAVSSGGNGSYMYNWSTGSTNTFIDSLSDGLYSVSVTDLRGCTDSISITITEPDSLLSSITYTDTLTCQYDGDGELTASAIGGTMPYTFNWVNGTNATVNNNLFDGNYQVTITDAQGCVDSSQFVITAQSYIVSQVDSVYDILCNADQSGFIKISADSGAAPYAYAWSNGVSLDTNVALDGGTYFYTITDAFGCVDSGNAFVFEPTPLVTTVDSVFRILCYGDDNGEIFTSATGGIAPYAWQWSNGDDSSAVALLDSGMYAYTVTDTNGCTTSDSALIMEPAFPLSNTFTVVDANCLGGANGSVLSTPQGGTAPYQYVWSTTDTTALAQNLSQGSYSVIITDSFNCTFFDTAFVNEPLNSDTGLTTKTNVSCFGFGNGTLTAQFVGGNAPYQYSWSTLDTTQTIGNLVPGGYGVTITDSVGCTQVAFDTISQPDSLVAEIIETDTIQCFGDFTSNLTTQVVGGTPSYNYAWSTNQQTQGVNGLGIGTYQVTVTDNNGCLDSAIYTVSQPDSLFISTLNVTPPSCNGFTDGQAFVAGTGGTLPYSFAWSTNESQDSAFALFAGIQSVTITDVHGCQTDSTFNVTEPAILQVSVDSITPANCDNSSDGSITVSSVGGNNGYQYNWSNADADSLLNDAPTGDYSVTVTDALGCVDSINVFLPFSNVKPVISLGNDTFFCESLTYTIVDNTPNVTKLWSTGDNGDSTTVDQTDDYWLEITDANGCANRDTVSVEMVFPTPLDIGKDSLVCADLGISPVLLSADGFESYAWNTGASSNAIVISESGQYTLEVTNAFGCISQDSINLDYMICYDPLIYPIPTAELLYVEWPRALYQDVKYTVISTTGALVHESVASSNQRHELLLKSLRPGAYFLIIEGDQFKLQERILITN